MASDPTRPSFSRRRKWSIGLDVFVRTIVVLAVVVMVNYLSGRHFHRLFLSSDTRIELSSRTVSVLRSLTNQVKVTLYYDKGDPLYSTLVALLKEFRNINPRVQVVTVDYQWDPAAAQKVKSTYKFGEATGEDDKNLVIFDCEGRPPKILPGNMLADYKIEQVPDQKEPFRRKLTRFNGEKLFVAGLLMVTGKPFRAYYLQGHGEHGLSSGDEVSGYMKFATILQQNYVQVQRLSLVGTNIVPGDCHLLIIAGPGATGASSGIAREELEKIGQYLDQGGRLFALFNSVSKDRESGLEKILARQGIIVGESAVIDVANSTKGSDIVVSAFSPHPMINPLLGYGLDLLAPRSVSVPPPNNVAADAPKVQPILFSGEASVLAGDPVRKPRRYPLAVAVEKSAPMGVVTDRGATRMVVVGDSFFLANGMIGLYANSDFARLAVNWLLDRTQLLEGVQSQPMTEFRILMTKTQRQTVGWILLAALPGTALLLGGLVWLRRRK